MTDDDVCHESQHSHWLAEAHIITKLWAKRAPMHVLNIAQLSISLPCSLQAGTEVGPQTTELVAKPGPVLNTVKPPEANVQVAANGHEVSSFAMQIADSLPVPLTCCLLMPAVPHSLGPALITCRP